MFKNYFSNQHSLFWLFTLLVCFGLTIPFLIQEGMFQDGTLYSCVARNMGMGIGSFWFPQFSELNVGGLSSFHEQPPLAFGIQSLFYRVFGDSILVERFYTFIALIINIMLVNLLWKEINRNKPQLISMGWLPVFLWITISVAFWSFRHNMMENTMSIFTLLSVYFAFRYFLRNENFALNALLCGIFIVLAMFTKGFPGLFPLSVSFLLWLVTNNTSFKRMVLFSVSTMFVMASIVGLVLLMPDAQDSLGYYFFDRFLNRVNTLPTTDDRFSVLYRLLQELILPVVITGVIMLIAKFKEKKDIGNDDRKIAIVLILVGFAGSLPFVLTLVQRGFYFTPALPFFGLGFAMLISDYLQNTISRINTSSITFRFMILLVFVGHLTVFLLTVKNHGKYRRHKEVIEDIKHISSVVDPQTTCLVPDDLYEEYEFSFQGYLMRYGSISINPDADSRYFICEVNEEHIPPGYEKIDLPTTNYLLFERKN